MAPLYLPLVTDREFGAQELPVQIGGISLFLQQKFTWFHKLPKFVHQLAEQARTSLRMAAKRMGMTSAKSLGEMALGSPARHRRPPVGRMAEASSNGFAARGNSTSSRFSNSLLTGLAPAIEKELGIPVVCSLQGEDSFLDTLPDPYREQCWEAMQHQCPQRAPFHRAEPVLRPSHAPAARCRRGADQDHRQRHRYHQPSPPRLRTRTGPPSATSPG
jgi:hypothetical protein